MKPQFKEPPDTGRNVWERRLQPLLEHPNQPALVHKSPTAGTAYSIRFRLATGVYRIPIGDWHFSAHKTDEGGEVYATYLGPKRDSDT